MFVTLLNSLKVTNYIPKKIVNKEMSDKYKHTEASNKYSGHAHSQNLYTSSLFLGMVKTCYFPLSLYPKPLVWLIGLVECSCIARFVWVMYTLLLYGMFVHCSVPVGYVHTTVLPKYQ